MPRAPFQILAFPHYRSDHGIEYAIFQRADAGYWQGIAGGGEDQETPLQAARREAKEEAGISEDTPLVLLDSCSTVPVVEIVGHLVWGPEVLVVPEYFFGIEVTEKRLTISSAHSTYQWAPYEKAHSLLKWDSNKNALWELHHRLKAPNTA